jgi:hypothetical protein
VLFFLCVKNAVRRIFMEVPLRVCMGGGAEPTTAKAIATATKVRDRVMFLLEHVLFSYWGYHVIVSAPWLHRRDHSQSLLHHPALIMEPSAPWSAGLWLGEGSAAADAFALFYLAKLGTHLEDCAYALWMGLGVAKPQTWTNINVVPNSSNNNINDNNNKTEVDALLESNNTETDNDNDKKEPKDKEKESGGAASDATQMAIHHVVTAVLCVFSYACGYDKFGAVVMFLHDVSDVPLDVLLIASKVNANKAVVGGAFVATVALFAYWRIFYLGHTVIGTIWCCMTRSSWNDTDDATAVEAERYVWMALLGTLWLLHCNWLRLICLHTWREVQAWRGGAAGRNK